MTDRATVDDSASQADAEDEPVRRGWFWRHPGFTALGALVVVALLVVGGWAWFLESKIAGVPKFGFGIERPHRPQRVASGGMNLLFAGVDDGHGTKLTNALQAPQWRPGVFRSDTIMIVHLNPQRTAAQLISIPRDSYVAIPGHGMNKINAAFSFGGPKLFGRTVEDFTGLYLDHMAVVDLAGFKDITDALGGVDLPVGGKNVHYNGDQALKYVRERKSLPRGDFSRIKRQQVFMQSVMRRAIGSGVLTNPVKLTGLVSASTSHLALDQAFTTGVIRSLGWQSRGLRPADVRFATIPTTGLGKVNGASIVRVDKAAVRKLFTAIAHDRYPG